MTDGEIRTTDGVVVEVILCTARDFFPRGWFNREASLMFVHIMGEVTVVPDLRPGEVTLS